MNEPRTLLAKRTATTLYRVDRWDGVEAAGQTVVLKVLDAETPTLEHLGRFLHELTVSRQLSEAGVSGVRRGYQRARFEGREALVLEFIDGQELASLPRVTDGARLAEVLDVAATVAETLRQVHEAGVVHRDIKPSNILLDKKGVPRIIDLGISSRIEERATHLGSPERLEGTLAYMSPEQTGRMNRCVDRRTDLYSFGATLYQLLTGRPPFEAGDALELVHCHLARRPAPPHTLNEAVPEVVSRLVMRLLEKNPEDRYQSALGLAADLRLVARAARESAPLEIELGKSDAPTRFTMVEKLYGREREREALLAAFERARSGRAELVTIAGPSGVGKSALVGEVHRPMTERRGHFTRAKFDQLSRSVPYSALTRAFSDFIGLLLTYDDRTLAVWREELSEAVGELGGALLGLMPNLPLALGELPRVPTLEGTAAQHRLRWVMRSFVRAASRADHPLVLFVDDLQWADIASLELLQALLTDPECQHLLVIAAYRDNEAPADHPLHAVIEAVAAGGVRPVALKLDNLDVVDVTAMIADTTRVSPEEAEPLARVVHEKTRGNAFFVHRFLTMLAERRLLEFDAKTGSWRARPEAVRAVEVTENVVDLLTDEMRAMDANLQSLLQRAASIGNRFELGLLSELSQQSRADLHRALGPALLGGLVAPVGRGHRDLEAAEELSRDITAEYGFAHDRVQQAAYLLVPEDERRAVHLEIGRILSRSLSDGDDTRVFEAARHMNAAASLIERPEERLATADLNLRAGRQALTAGAFKQALEHADRGLGLLPEDPWSAAYDTTAGLHLLASQVAALVMDEARGKAAADEVIANARTGLEKARAYGDLALVAMAKEDLVASIELGRKALLELGVRFPQNPLTLHIILALLRVKLTLRGRVEELADAPPLEDARVEAALILMDRLLPAAFRAGSKLFPLFVFEMVRLSAIYGASCYSVASYAAYSIALCAVLKDYERGYRFAKTALVINERYPRGMGQAVFNIFVRHWKEPLVNSVEGFVLGYRESMALGDLYQGMWCACYRVLFMYVTGSPLARVAEEYARQKETLTWDEGTDGMRRMITQVIVNLTTPVDSPHKIEGEHYDEGWVLRRFRERNDATEIGHYRNFSLQLCVFFGRTDEGLVHADEIEKHVDGLNPMYFWPLMHFLSAIVRLCAYRRAAQPALLKKARASLKVLRGCAAQSPVNYEHMLKLVEAEMAFATGRDDARTRYDQAIASARSRGAPVQDQALACELAAAFHERAGDAALATKLKEQAAQAYLEWGATILAERLGGAAPRSRSAPASLAFQTTQLASSSTSSAALDVMSVVKASQAISRSLVLHDLMKSLLHTLLENAGAQRGFLVLKGEDELSVEAGGPEGVVLHQSSIESRDDLAKSIVRYVERTMETVVLGNAAGAGQFQSDPYLMRARPKSVLCMPIIQKQRLVAVLYLENNLATDAFTEGRCRVLTLLSAQAAISLENAMLYDTLDARVRQRTRELSEANRELSEALSRLRETQKQLITQEKLASLGALTAGIAHEIKNPLNFVNNFAELSAELFAELHQSLADQRDRLDPDALDDIESTLGFLRQNVQKISEHGKNANKIINGMLLHARDTAGRKEPVDLNALVAESVNLAHHGMRGKDNGFNVVIKTEYDEALGQVDIVGQDMSRVFINVINNACDAARQKQRSAGPTYTPELFLRTKSHGDKVEVRIRDNGTGIPADVIPKIFNPFFTTKPTGEGTGLGLSISHDIVVQMHQGEIDVKTQAGEFTEFVITLPRSARA